VTLLLVLGIRESARANAVIVAVKVFVVGFVIVAGLAYVRPENWQPFAPQGWSGIMGGAATVFFAYIGFDAVTTAAEEARQPERDMTVGILGSLGVCTLLYLAVSAVVTGMSPLAEIDRAAPVAVAFSRIGLDFAAGLISVGAIAGLSSVLVVMLLGQSRVFFAMSRDGLLPPVFSRVHPRFHTPHVSTLGVGAVVAAIAAFVPLKELVELVNIGTLFAFVIVSAGVIVLRRTQPELRRPFRCPWVPVVPLFSIAGCFYLMASLPWVTWERFVIWLVIGLCIYALYGRRHSRLHQEAGALR
jgi:APA family basic amino acid/polyamine antiporter